MKIVVTTTFLVAVLAICLLGINNSVSKSNNIDNVFAQEGISRGDEFREEEDWNPEFNGASGMWNKFDLFFGPTTEILKSNISKLSTKNETKSNKLNPVK